MTCRCRRRRHHLAVLLAAVGGILAALAGPATAMPARTAAATEHATITLVERPAWAPPNGRLTFAVAITGADTGEDLAVEVRVGRALRDVDELDASRTGDVGRVIHRSDPVPVDELAVGDDGTLLVTLDVADGTVDTGEETGDDGAAPRDPVVITSPGVHPVVLALEAEGETVDEARTPLVRTGTDDDPLPAPTLGVVVDLAAPPSLRADGSVDLAPAVRARLGRAVSLVEDLRTIDVTVFAVPDTLEAVASLLPDRSPELADRIGGVDAVALPYLPVSVDSLVATDLVGLLPAIAERGRLVTRRHLATTASTGTWDARWEISPGSAEILSGLGYERLVVSSAHLDREPTDADSLTPIGPVAIEGMGQLTAVVVDAELSRRLAAPIGRAADAAHVLLAELVLRGDDEPGVLVRADLARERSALAALTALLDQPDAPVAVGGLDAALERVDADLDPDQVDPVAWAAPTGPDLRDVAPRVLDLAPLLASHAALTTPSPDHDLLVRTHIATAISSAASPGERERAITAAERLVTTTLDGVGLAGQTDVNLSSRRGTVPVTIGNDNPFAVEVLVRLRSDRLGFPDGDLLAATVEPGGRRVDVPVEALATGSVPVFVELWTADDGHQLDARALNVRSTAISGVGLAISLGALTFLVIWWVRNWRKTKRTTPAEGRDDGSSQPSAPGGID